MSLMRQAKILRDFDPKRGVSVATLAYEYGAGHQVPEHAHGADQLIYAIRGVMEVFSGANMWLIPPGFALWISAQTRHRIHMPGAVSMRTLYLRPGLARTRRRGGAVLHVTAHREAARAAPPRASPSRPAGFAPGIGVSGADVCVAAQGRAGTGAGPDGAVSAGAGEASGCAGARCRSERENDPEDLPQGCRDRLRVVATTGSADEGGGAAGCGAVCEGGFLLCWISAIERLRREFSAELWHDS
jgi:mannose-6-phosphate isomerase-like protein (cupin superfamily)